MTTSTMEQPGVSRRADYQGYLECFPVRRESGERSHLVVPASFPRVAKTPCSMEFNGEGHGIHWPELDEDISVENVLFGQPSGEGARSFSRWKEWYQQKPTGPDAPPKLH